MTNKTLSRAMYQLMFAGCISVSMAMPAQAENLYQRYWQSVSGQLTHSSQSYRFRPMADSRRPVPQYNNRFSIASRMTSNYPGFENRHLRFRPMVTAARPVPQVFRASYGSRYRVAQVPAFARQFAWNPAARATVTRHGQAQNFYASETSNSYAQVTEAPAYRSAPVTAHGFRFRDSQRSAPYVTFSERVRQFLPEHNYSSSTNVVAQVKQTIPMQRDIATAKPMEVVEIKPVVQAEVKPVVQAQVKQPVKSDVKIFMSGQTMPSVSDYNFRPVDGVGEPANNAVPSEYRVVEPEVMPVQPVPVEVEQVQLANAQFEAPAANPWDNWSFRPAEVTFQR